MPTALLEPPFARLEDVPDALLDLGMTFVIEAVPPGSRTKWHSRILMDITEAWYLKGRAVVETNAIAREYGIRRRALCRGIRALKGHGAITEIGRTEAGSPIFLPNLAIVKDRHAERVRDREAHFREREMELADEQA